MDGGRQRGGEREREREREREIRIPKKTGHACIPLCIQSSELVINLQKGWECGFVGISKYKTGLHSPLFGCQCFPSE
jgi:hypothetical protein